MMDHCDGKGKFEMRHDIGKMAMCWAAVEMFRSEVPRNSNFNFGQGFFQGANAFVSSFSAKNF